MAAWLYQLNQTKWPLRKFNVSVHEKRTSEWYRRRRVGRSEPVMGDTLYFYYAHTVSAVPGFHGVARVTFADKEVVEFEGIRPTNVLQRHPWWDAEAKDLAVLIRRGSRGTMFDMTDRQEAAVKKGIAKSLADALRKKKKGA